MLLQTKAGAAQHHRGYTPTRTSGLGLASLPPPKTIPPAEAGRRRESGARTGRPRPGLGGQPGQEAEPGPGCRAWAGRAAWLGVIRIPEGRLRWPRRLNRVGELEYSGKSKERSPLWRLGVKGTAVCGGDLGSPVCEHLGSKGYVL